MKNIVLFHDSKISEVENFLEFSLLGRSSTIAELDYDNTFSHLLLSERKTELNPGILKQDLGKQRINYHIISVEPYNAKISSVAARDGRVDAIVISEKSSLKIFNLRYAASFLSLGVRSG